MLAQTLDWAAINSGTTNLAGLATIAGELVDAFSACLARSCCWIPIPSRQILPDGAVRPVARGQNLHLAVRPAPRSRSC